VPEELKRLLGGVPAQMPGGGIAGDGAPEAQAAGSPPPSVPIPSAPPPVYTQEG